MNSCLWKLMRFLILLKKMTAKKNWSNIISKNLIEDIVVNTTDSISTLSKDKSRYKKGGDYYASKRAIEFLKLFENLNISMIARFSLLSL